MHEIIIFIIIAVAKDNIPSDSLLATNVASESTVRDSQPSLDLASATSGDKIVTAQVGELLLYLIQGYSNFMQLAGLMIEAFFSSLGQIFLCPLCLTTSLPFLAWLLTGEIS